MSSTSSNSAGPVLAIGRIAGFRGRAGEMTVRVASGDASRWTGIHRILVGRETGAREDAVGYDVEHARAYRDRLVVKLRGVEDAGAAQELRGHWVFAPAGEVPALPDRTHYVARLVGIVVSDETLGRLGTVVDVTSSGGADLLVIEDEAGREILVPFVREIVLEVREDLGTARVRLPEGLAELNRDGGAAS